MKQDPIDGVSMAYTFADAQAPGRKTHPVFREQRQPRDLSRRLDRRGLRPADSLADRSARPRDTGTPTRTSGSFTTSRPTFREDDDLAAKEPERLDEMKTAVPDGGARTTRCFRSAAGLWTRLHPEDRIKVPYTHWAFDATTTRLPEFAGPGLGRESNRVVVDARSRQGRLGRALCARRHRRRPDALHGQGQLVYEYNMMMIERYIGRSARPLAAGKHRIVVDTAIAKPGGPADVAISRRRRRRRCASRSKRTVAGAFSASETFDVGVDLGSPVSFDYFDRAPVRVQRQDRKGRRDTAIEAARGIDRPHGRRARREGLNDARVLLLAVLAMFCVVAFGAAAAADQKPNIVFIMADDLGNADLGYRGGEIKTPNIDKLAKDGVRCESFYGEPVCTPVARGADDRAAIRCATACRRW